MNVWFRLAMTREEADNYFANELPSRDGNTFYAKEEIKKLEKGDFIYFSYGSRNKDDDRGYIKARAVFTGETDLGNIQRSSEYPNGYKLENIEIIDSSAKLNNKILPGPNAHLYINNDLKQSEINRALANRDDERYVEGAKKKVLANAYNRNSHARSKCIEHYGTDCQVCNFSFERFYGDIGKNYIHVHHINPMYEKLGEYEVDPINNLIPVCANCHLMLHQGEPVFTVSELRKRIRSD